LRSTIVERIEAYVEGRPMPSSSSFLTRLASVYRGGGDVSWPFATGSDGVSAWPSASCGRRSSSLSASRSSSRPSSYAARKPRTVMTVPLAENCASRPPAASPTTTVAVEPVASTIWEATVRRQMRS
jgi:hypothetical protein